MKIPDPRKIDPDRVKLEELTVSGFGQLYNWVLPIDYIRRAKNLYEDYEEPEDIQKKLILSDALSNCKKAIEYQVDTILSYFGMLKKRTSLGQKIELIQLMDILPLDLIKSLIDFRNKTEHEHYLPEKYDVKAFINISEMFHRIFNKLKTSFIFECLIYINDEEYFGLFFDERTNKITIKIPIGEEVIPENEKPTGLLAHVLPAPKTRTIFSTQTISSPSLRKKIKNYSEKDKLYLLWAGFLMKIQL